MSKISNAFRTVSARTRSLWGRSVLTMALYAAVVIFSLTGGITATNAYVTGETPREFFVRITGSVRDTEKGQSSEEGLVAGVEKEKERETDTVKETVKETEPTPEVEDIPLETQPAVVSTGGPEGISEEAPPVQVEPPAPLPKPNPQVTEQPKTDPPTVPSTVPAPDEDSTPAIEETYAYHDYYPIILYLSDNYGTVIKSSGYNGYRGPSLGPWSTRSLEIGDEVRIKVEASDPKDRPILYLWDSNNERFRQEFNGTERGQAGNWTSNNEINYTITQETLNNSGELFRIVVSIKSEKEYFRNTSTVNNSWDDQIFIDYRLVIP